MKKIALYLSCLVVVAYFVACNLNESPKFDDADAFVAFGSASYSVSEDSSSFKIPVRLTSLGKKTSAVTFQVFDVSAVAGKDYQLSGGASVINFDGSDPVQYINLDIIGHPGVFTGDLKFGIALSGASNGINLGSNDTTYVTILDLDHPLAAILGDYTAVGTSYFNGTQSWAVTLAKDPGNDVTKVWITNLVAGGSSASTPLYGIVNADKTEIKIPVGQTVATSTSYPSIIFEGFYGPDGDEDIPTGGSVTCIIGKGTIAIQDEFGSDVYDAAGVSQGWYNIFHADVVLTKK